MYSYEKQDECPCSRTTELEERDFAGQPEISWTGRNSHVPRALQDELTDKKLTIQQLRHQVARLSQAAPVREASASAREKLVRENEQLKESVAAHIVEVRGLHTPCCIV